MIKINFYKKLIRFNDKPKPLKRSKIVTEVIVPSEKGVPSKINVLNMNLTPQEFVVKRNTMADGLSVSGAKALSALAKFDQLVSEMEAEEDDGEFSAMAPAIISDFNQKIRTEINKDSSLLLGKIIQKKVQEFRAIAAVIDEGMAKGMLDAMTIIESTYFKTPEEDAFEKEIIKMIDSGEDFALVAPEQFLTDPTYFEKLTSVASFRGVIIPDFTMKKSHITIISRDKGLFVIDIDSKDISKITNGSGIILRQDSLNSMRADLIVNPSTVDLKAAKRFAGVLADIKSRKESFSKLLAITKDGLPINVSVTVSANTDSQKDPIKKNGASNDVGLSRKELGFSSETSASEVADKGLQSWRVRKSKIYISRTSDITSDKGKRSDGIKQNSMRYSLYTDEGLDLFVRDVVADLAISGVDEVTPNKYMHGSYHIMFPNIQDVQEIKDAKQIIEYCKKALSGEFTGLKDKYLLDTMQKHILNIRKLDWVPNEGAIPFDKNIHIGAMIENPWAVRDIEEIEKEVMFVKLGKNDTFHYINYMLDNYPEYFEYKDVQGPEGIVLKHIPFLKSDVGSFKFSFDDFLEIADGDDTLGMELQLTLKDAGIIDSDLNVISTDLSKLTDKYKNNVLLASVIERITLSVDDLPGRETSSKEDIISIISKPKNIRYLSYLYHSFQSVPFAGSCGGEGSLILAPIEIASGLRNMTLMESDKLDATLYIRDLSYAESLEILREVVDIEGDNHEDVMSILKDRFYYFMRDFEVNSASPEYESEAIAVQKTLERKNQKVKVYRSLLDSLTVDNYKEKLKDVLVNIKVSEMSFESSLYALTERVFRESYDVSNTKTYDVRRFFNADNKYEMYVRKIGKKPHDSRYAAEFIDGSHNRKAIVPMLLKENGRVALTPKELKVRKDGDNLYFDASEIEADKKIYFKIIDGKIFVKIDEKELYHQYFDELTRLGIGKAAGSSSYSQMNGTPYAVYYDNYIPSQQQLDKALNSQKFSELQPAIAQSTLSRNLVNKVEKFLFSERGYEEIHREKSTDHNGIPERQMIFQFTDFNRYCDLFIDALNSNKKISFGNSPENGALICYIDDKKIDRINLNPNLKIGLDRIIYDFRDAVNNKIDGVRYDELEKKKTTLLNKLRELELQTTEN